jgi:hypothetical protein
VAPAFVGATAGGRGRMAVDPATAGSFSLERRPNGAAFPIPRVHPRQITGYG